MCSRNSILSIPVESIDRVFVEGDGCKQEAGLLDELYSCNRLKQKTFPFFHRKGKNGMWLVHFLIGNVRVYGGCLGFCEAMKDVA